MSIKRRFLRLVLPITVILVIAGVVYASAIPGGTLLMITQKAAVGRGIAADAIEEINDDKFMITYECAEGAVVGAVSIQRSAVAIATNYTYPFVMQLVMKSGGFFTSAHQEHGQRVAVLNEKAAFDLFGGVEIPGNDINMDGVSYRVLGVVDDNDDEFLNIYIPITLTGVQPGEFAVRLDKRVSEAYVKSELKGLGITDTDYEFERAAVMDEILAALGL